MSEDSSIRPGNLFGKRSAPCVPIDLRHDGSEFAKRIVHTFRALAGTELCEVLTEEARLDAPPKPVDAQDRLPESIELLSHQPRWAVFLADMDGSGEQAKGLRTAYDSFDTHQRISLLVVAGTLEGETPPGNVEILMERNTQSHRFTVDSLGQAAGCWLFIAWRTYCERNDSRFDDALCLPVGGSGVQPRRFTLGCGTSGIDLDYHARRYAHRLAAKASADWLSPHARGEPGKLPTARDLVAFHLPTPEFVMMDGETRPRRNEIVIGQDILSIGYHRKMPPLPRRTLRNARNMLARFVTAASRHLAILQMGALPQIRRFVGMRAERFPKWTESQIQPLLAIPDEEEGLFAQWKTSLEKCSGWLDALADSSLHTPPHKPPHRLVAKARRGVERFPNLVGGLIRWALIAVALLWLGYGQNFIAWAAGTPESQILPSDPRYNVALDTVSGILLVSLLVLWVFSAFRISRLIHLAGKFMLTRLILAACQLTVASLQKTGRRLREDVGVHSRRLETLVADWRAKTEKLPAEPLPQENRENDIVTDLAVDQATEPFFEQSRMVFRDSFRESLGLLVDASSGDRHAASVHPDNWFAACGRAASESARHLLLQISFDRLADSAGLDAGQREDCFKRAVESSRRPFHRNAAANGREVSGLPPSWSGSRLEADRVELRGVRLPCLAVLAVYPLLDDGQPEQQNEVPT